MILKTDLLPHQRHAVAKQMQTRVGALFMEMGTGKSRTAIELAAQRENRIRHVVWFCPVSLKETIRGEILKHVAVSPDEICLFDTRTTQRTLPAVRWYVVGIESMSTSRRVILTVHALIRHDSMVIVDESSYIKGHRAARTCWITDLSKKARYRLILTGTPLSQGVVDLFAQMRFLSPKILGYRSFYSFAANHLEYHEKYKGMIVASHNTEHIAAKIQPYVYQVTKADCLNLPKKLYESRWLTLTREQADYYERAKYEILFDLVDDQLESYTIFRLFTALQQIVCGFWNRYRNGERVEALEFSHGRLEELQEVIASIPTNEKVILWAKYEHDILSIHDHLEHRDSGSTALFYGRLNERQRNAALDRWRREARFLIATQSCGGHGLTLNEANYVVFYSNSFKYAERQQAEDRNHRIGQERPVTYVDLICTNSIDERIQTALGAKGNAVQEFRKEVEKVKDKRKLKKMVEAL